MDLKYQAFKILTNMNLCEKPLTPAPDGSCYETGKEGVVAVFMHLPSEPLVLLTKTGSETDEAQFIRSIAPRLASGATNPIVKLAIYKGAIPKPSIKTFKDPHTQLETIDKSQTSTKLDIVSYDISDANVAFWKTVTDSGQPVCLMYQSSGRMYFNNIDSSGAVHGFLTTLSGTYAIDPNSSDSPHKIEGMASWAGSPIPNRVKYSV